MATLTIQNAVITGLEQTYAAASAGGDVFANDGNTFIHIKNGDTSDHTVTVTATHPNPPPGTALNNKAIVVTQAEERIIGPFNQKGYNNASGQVALTYDAVTSVTIAAIRLPK